MVTCRQARLAPEPSQRNLHVSRRFNWLRDLGVTPGVVLHAQSPARLRSLGHTRQRCAGKRPCEQLISGWDIASAKQRCCRARQSSPSSLRHQMPHADGRCGHRLAQSTKSYVSIQHVLVISPQRGAIQFAYGGTMLYGSVVRHRRCGRTDRLCAWVSDASRDLAAGGEPSAARPPVHPAGFAGVWTIAADAGRFPCGDGPRGH